MLVPETLLRKEEEGEVVVEIGAGRGMERVLTVDNRLIPIVSRNITEKIL